MATVSITGLLTGSSTPLLASGDVMAWVDISDTTQSPSGSTVKATLTQFFAAIPVPIVVTSASANAFAVGLNGVSNPAFTVDASTALQVAGLKVTGAVTGGTVAVVVTDSGSNANLSVNAKGTGTIGIGSVSTGRVTITPVTTITGALTLSSTLTYGGVTLSNSVTGTGSMVLSASPTLTGTLTVPTVAATGTTGSVVITSSTGTNAALLKLVNTGGNYFVGAQNSTGGLFGAGAYDFVIEMPSLGNSVVISHSTGAVTLPYGLTITTGGLTVSSGTSALQDVTATTLTVSGGAGASITRGSATALTAERTGSAGTIASFVYGTEKASIDSTGALVLSAGITATTGTFSAALAATTGTFSGGSRTRGGSVSANTATFTTLETPTSAAQGLYLYQMWVGGQGSAYGAYAIVSMSGAGGSTGVILRQDNSGNSSFQMSGGAVQAQQASGSTATINWSVLRIF